MHHLEARRLESVGQRVEPVADQPNPARVGKRLPGAELRFVVRQVGIDVDPHALAGGAHLGSEDRHDAAELPEREHDLLHRVERRRGRLGEPDLGQRPPGRDQRRVLRERMPDRLRQVRDGAAGARIRLDDVQLLAPHHELEVDQAPHADRLGQADAGVPDPLQDLGREAHRRHDAGAVARVDPGALDVLHDAGDHRPLAVAERVDVQLDRALHEVVHQDRGTSLELGVHDAQVGVELLVGADDQHGAPAQHVAGPDHHGVADLVRQPLRVLGPCGDAARRLVDAQLAAQRMEAVAVLRTVDRRGRRPPDRHARPIQPPRQLQRRLPAELHDHAFGLLVLDEVHDVLERQRLEVQPVGGVVVGRDGLGVRVHHDRLEPGIPQRPDGVDRGVVELHALTDPVRTRAEDHDLGLLGGDHLVLPLVRRVVVRRVRLELGGAGVDGLVHRRAPARPPGGPQLVLVDALHAGQVDVGEPETLDLAPLLPRPLGGSAEAADLLLGLGDLGQLRQEPRVDPGALVQRLRTAPAPQQLDHRLQPHRVRGQQRLERVHAQARRRRADVELQGAQRFLQALLERPPDRHDLAHRAHLGAQAAVGARELLEREARDLRHHVVDRRLERRLRLGGDVVGELVEVVADREQRGDLGDRVAGRLRRQRRGARDARVHLDHDHVAVGGVDRELDVRAAGIDPDLADDRDAVVAKLLVLLVR